MNQSLAWLYGRQSGPAGDWLANALFTAGATSTLETQQPASGLVECGLTSLVNFLTGLTASGAQEAPLAMTQIESIVATLPPGLLPDNQLGPDGYPVNESGVALAWGNLLVNGYTVSSAMQQSINTLLYSANATQITPGPPQTPGVIAKWTANSYYPFGTLIVDSNDNTQIALYNGVTVNTSAAPNWPMQPGALTADNTQVWKLIALGYQNIGWVATGYVFNLLQALGSYRVDVFVYGDVWYYQGSSSLQTTAPGGNAIPNAGTWSLGSVHPGQLLAVLYPTSVSRPATGWYGSTIPGGWVAHTNTGVAETPGPNQLGGKLLGYKAQIYVKTDIEYLQEDNIPIVVQSDGFHARVGLSVVPSSGTPAVHILFDDPVAGWTEVYDSLQSELVYQDLPRSYDIPTSDPLFVANPGATNLPALQNRSYIYDCALALIAYSSAGNFAAAEKVIKQLNAFLATSGYLASMVLENAEDGSTARWSKSGSGATVTNVAASAVSPQEPPYGTGNILDFHAGSANAIFTFTGSGFPDTTDTHLSFEHMEAAAVGLLFDISIATALGLVTDIQVTSAPAGPATLAGRVITIPIGPGSSTWRTTLVDLPALLSSLTSDTLVKVTGFKLTLTAANTDLYFDNFSVGTPQPANSLSFSYDTYNGQVDQPYIRAGAMAWVVYAYCIYMQTSQDYSSWLQLQGMIDFLLSLQSSASDLTNGLFYEGYGEYVDPGYQFVPGLTETVATEHQVDLWFAFMRAAGVLSNAAVQLLKTGQITNTQATSITSTVATIETAASTIWTNLLANLYIAPSGSVPGHFAQGASAPVPWTLRRAAGLTAWYEADAIAGLTDGQPLTLWADQSGNGNSLTASGSLAPTYQTDALNGLPVVSFNGSNSMQSAVLALNQPTTVFIVGNSAVDSILIDGLSQPFSMSMFGNGGLTNLALSAGAGVTLQQNVASLSNYAVMGGIFNGASSLNSYNGTVVTGNAGDRNASGLVVGSSPGPLYELTGSIAEVLVFNSVLTTTERQQVEGYLAWKWGLQANLPSGHPYKSAAPGGSRDTSEALDASGHWAALLAHANGRDDIALQCAEFAYQNFLLTNQTIAKSNAANSYNETYQLATPFAGMKPYNDSPGGYAGSPASVWQEGTWGMILVLLDLYNVPGLASFFTGLGTTIDAVLTQLIQGQATILPATGNGSLLAYSLAARSLPYEFEVWPALAPTAWMWLVATNPSVLLTVAGQPQLLPYMYIPSGAEQSIDDKNGSSSVGQMEIRCIDPGGLLHTLAAQEELIGQIATFSMGFPGNALGDFVPLHVLQISEIGFDADGRVIIKASDVKRFAQGAFVWANGGPEEWLPGQKNTWQPGGAQWLANAFPVSNDNPRWVSGNPLDIFLAAMQNELGVGQDQALSAVVQVGGAGELVAAVNPFWAKYLPASTLSTEGNQSTLINPNFFLDVPSITALRDNMFSGDWFEFKITSTQQARSWLEDQILKPLGLVMVVTANGQLTLKPLKNPVNQSPVFAFTQRNIQGIPQVSLAPIINALAYRLNVDETMTNTSARTYNTTVTMLQQDSYNLFRYLYNQQVEATGLRTARGGFLRAFLLGDQLFRRYGFATPVYQIATHLAALRPELKDWVSLTHPLVPDYIGGGRGVLNVPCEIIGRSPDYANGQVRFTLLNMRRANTTTPYEIASGSSGMPPYSQATEEQQQTFFFISPSSGGVATQELGTIF